MSKNIPTPSKLDFAIHDIFYSVADLSKAETARQLGISPRTVGRALVRVSEWVDKQSNSEFDTDPDFDVEAAQYNPAQPFVKYSVIASDDSITVGNCQDSVTISSEDPRFDDISTKVWSSRGAQEVLAEVFDTLSEKRRIEKMTFGRIEIDPEHYCVTFDGQRINPALTDRIISAAQDDDKAALNGLVKFTQNLYENPSYRAVNELYSFLKAADILITEDGLVECFKRVRYDFMDVYSGTFDNSVGKVCKVPRHMVDEDSDVTCSHGLHVCSKAYLAHYSGDKVVKVLVHPKDFVAIPKDYYRVDENQQVQAKARVCEYKVVKDVTEEWEADHYKF